MENEFLFEDRVLNNLLSNVFQGYCFYIRAEVNCNLYGNTHFGVNEKAESICDSLPTYLFDKRTENYNRFMAGDCIFIFFESKDDIVTFLEKIKPFLLKTEAYLSFDCYDKYQIINDKFNIRECRLS